MVWRSEGQASTVRVVIDIECSKWPVESSLRPFTSGSPCSFGLALEDLQPTALGRYLQAGRILSHSPYPTHRQAKVLS